MRTDEEVLVDMEVLAETEGCSFVDKETSLFMIFLSKFLFFNRDFLQRYITVLGGKIYVPEGTRNSPRSLWRVTAHELVHRDDFRKWFGLGEVLYLSPQILAVLFLLTPLGFVWEPFFWCGIFILMLAPVPSYFRKYFEMRGYAMTMAIDIWEDQSLGRDPIKEAPLWIVDQFTTAKYYFIWPFRSSVKKELDVWVERIHNETVQDYLPFVEEIRAFVQK